MRLFVGRARWLIRGNSTIAAVLQTAVVQVATVAANIATGILTARLLAPAGRGEVAAINLIPTFLGLLLTFGIPSALLYNLKRHADDQKELIGAALITSSALGLIGIVAGYFLMPYALHQYSVELIAQARLFLLAVPLTLYSYVCAVTFETRGQFWYTNGSRLLTPLLTLAGLIGFALAHRLDAFTAAASYVVPGMLVGAKMLADVFKTNRPVFFPLARRHYGKLGSYGLRSFGIDLLKTIGQQIDQVLVVAFLSPAAMGLYAVSLAVSRVLQLFQTSVVRVLLPKISARPTAEVVSSVARSARITAALTAVPCTALVVLAPFLLRLAYGSKFLDATVVLRVLTIEAFFAGSTLVLAQTFLALGKPGIISMLQGVGLALSVPLMILLIPRLGILGAALALLLSTLARFALVLLSYPLLLHTSPPGVLLTASDVLSIQRRLRRSRVLEVETVA